MNEKNLNILKNKINLVSNIVSRYKETSKINKDELYENLCDCLGWFEINKKHFMNGNDYLDSDNILSNDDKKILSALTYINNKKKHSKDIIVFENITKNLYPSEDLYPSKNLFTSANDVYWSTLIPKDNKYINQYNNYIKYIANNTVISILNKVYSILENYYNHYYNK